MGNFLTECIRKQQINKGEISMTRESHTISDEYIKKTTPEDILTQLISKRLKHPHTPVHYSRGSVKVSVL